tara:strand:- start:903 stop:1115 length:213 start_codon:yes stop_codon:yes gene_type:complete
LGHRTAAVFLTFIILDLRRGLIYSSSAATKSQKADYSNEKEFHFCWLPPTSFAFFREAAAKKLGMAGRRR